MWYTYIFVSIGKKTRIWHILAKKIMNTRLDVL